MKGLFIPGLASRLLNLACSPYPVAAATGNQHGGRRTAGGARSSATGPLLPCLPACLPATGPQPTEQRAGGLLGPIHTCSELLAQSGVAERLPNILPPQTAGRMTAGQNPKDSGVELACLFSVGHVEGGEAG